MGKSKYKNISFLLYAYIGKCTKILNPTASASGVEKTMFLAILAVYQLRKNVRGLWGASTKEVLFAGFSKQLDDVKSRSMRGESPAINTGQGAL